MFNDVSRRQEFRQLYGGRVASSMYKLSVKVGPRKGQGLGKGTAPRGSRFKRARMLCWV